MARPVASDREAVLALLRRHGREATSFQVLEPGYRYAMFGDDACVAFVDTGAAWVAAGAPICAPDELPDVAEAFVARARQAGRRAVFFATEGELVDRTPRLRHMVVGQEPICDPRRWPETLRASRSLREQLRRATSKGVEIERIDARALHEDAALRDALDDLVQRWLDTKPMAPMGFVVSIEIEAFAEERRRYAAWHEGKLVAFLGLIPIFAKRGWFFEDLIRDRHAPNGTMELLVDAAMRDLAAAEVSHATFGLSPLEGSVPSWLRRARSVGRTLYDFRGLSAWKQKFRPSSLCPVYLSHPHDVSPLRAVLDALTAFSRRGLVWFGIATFLRGPDVVVRGLGLLLVPWTLAMLSVDRRQWFFAPWARDGWVAFDVVLAVALFILAARWRRSLATVLAVAISADAFATLVEVVTWNARRVRGLLDACVLVVAVSAPSLAAIVMWQARARRGAA